MKMSYDLFMNHKKAKKMVNKKGWDEFFNHISDQYDDYNLYSCSQDWLDDKSYTCKFKGADGDVLIGWEGVHDKC